MDAINRQKYIIGTFIPKRANLFLPLFSRILT